LTVLYPDGNCWHCLHSLCGLLTRPKVRMGCGSWAMDIHESGVSDIGISPAARHVCCATLVYSHSATGENIAKGYIVHITSAGGKSVVTQTSN
jgi:hypothetical protein